MKRLTMSLDDELADAFDALTRERGYENRSEAFRDLLRHDLAAQQRAMPARGACVATLSYICDHRLGPLAARQVELRQLHHALSIATTHTPLDRERCMAVAVLRGRADKVQALARQIVAQPGVMHAHLHLLPA